ncbi:cytochrome c551/c552 [Pedobacter sp. BAL39]|uniref:c-type cytochrome n=1 Tax=Pedobacter sp. BAL39 TaxID=391596 RepID=UPI0001559545|nr:c-type cytochrome [Pedobacter sp. BAL39]EDM35647.1 cytochrome c551/c552 [Pedobacter sp. BAL39]
MKQNLFIAACFAAVLASCGGSPESRSTSTTSTSTSVDTGTTVAPATPSAKHPGEILIAKSDCIGCHNKVQKVVGPSYTEVAEKYTNDDKTVALLADKIIAGGKGVWGEVPMTPHASLSKDDAKEMVKYILSLKK